VISRAVLSAAISCLLVASCTPGGSESGGHPSAPAFDGTFTAEFGVRTTVRGTLVPDTSVTVTWVARSACGDNGCVATATEFPPDERGDPRPSTMVFDFVDGHWVSVTAEPAQCPSATGEPLDVEAWQTFVLDPKPDGALVGTYTNRSSVGGACFSATQPVTITRTADANPEARVADPAAQPARVPSPASGLWGSYRVVETNPATGQIYPPTIYAGNTHCLRTGERCLSYFVDPQSSALLVMTFAYDHWASVSAPLETPCGNGETGMSVVTGTVALPQPVSDPIMALTGSNRTDLTGRCPKTLTVDTRLERTGNGPGKG